MAQAILVIYVPENLWRPSFADTATQQAIKAAPAATLAAGVARVTTAAEWLAGPELDCSRSGAETRPATIISDQDAEVRSPMLRRTIEAGLKRVGLDLYLILLILTVVLASLLPEGGIAEGLSTATFWAVALLFFLYGARLSLSAALPA